MTWFWYRYRMPFSGKHGDEGAASEDEDPMAHFLALIDRMLFVATAALIVCVGALLIE